MKKIISTVAAAALIATSSFALDTDKAYGAAAIAIEGMTNYDSGMALVLTGGVPFMAAGEAGPGTLAIEGELTYTMSSPSVSETYISGYDYNTFTPIEETVKIEASLMTLGAYAAYKYDINEQTYVKPRLGLIYKSIEFDGFSSGSDSEIGLAMGVQAGYKINEKLDAVVGYNMVDGSDITHLTVGAVYRY